MPESSTKILGIVLLLIATCTAGIASVNLDRMQELALSRYGPDTERTVVEWRELINQISGLADTHKIEQVNEFFNRRIRWRQDVDIWQQQDYWATPLEMMARGEGDCEDYSIAKYMTLLLAGVDVSRLRITYVRARRDNAGSTDYQSHMVLAYYSEQGAEPVILDNLNARVLPASARNDLTPVFGFNSEGLWVGGATGAASTDPAARLSRWRDLLRRMTADGLG